MVSRKLSEQIESGFSKQKVTLLLGARRVGKTRLLRQLYERYPKALWLDGENTETAELLERRSTSNYLSVLNGAQLLFIDEAQYIPDITRKAKLMIDTIEPLHIVLSGSSAFKITQEGEPLVGRALSYVLYPVSQDELQPEEGLKGAMANLETRLIYGAYPEQLNFSQDEKRQYLKDLVRTFILKDILAFEGLRQPTVLIQLLQLIAYQIGAEVSLQKLSRELGISKTTVERYLHLLSQVFILHSRGGYSNNLRKEVTQHNRWYFCDNGIRNAVIGKFDPLALRNDVGALWEQYLVNERQKHNDYNRKFIDPFFWRTYDQQEIDLVEVENGHLSGYEMKWSDGKAKKPIAFAKAYPDAAFGVIARDNYLPFITGKG